MYDVKPRRAFERIAHKRSSRSQYSDAHDGWSVGFPVFMWPRTHGYDIVSDALWSGLWMLKLYVTVRKLGYDVTTPSGVVAKTSGLMFRLWWGVHPSPFATVDQPRAAPVKA